MKRIKMLFNRLRFRFENVPLNVDSVRYRVTGVKLELRRQKSLNGRLTPSLRRMVSLLEAAHSCTI